MWRSAGLVILAAPLLLAQGTVEGTVVNSISRTPIPGAIVELSVAGIKEPVNRTVAGATGAFRFSDLPPGEYTPAFDADDYFASHQSGPCCKPFRITSAGETLHIDGELDPITKVRGRVLDADGKPVAGVRVEITGRQMGMSFTTDADGNYHVSDLTPGAYLLLARPNRGLKLPGNVKVNQPPPTKDKTAWAPTYYPGVADPAQAVRVRATGGELYGYDIRLRSVPLYRIRGVVRDENGNPAAKAAVTLRPADIREISGNPDAEAVTGAGGSFEFTDVAPGNWRIAADFKRDGLALSGFTVRTVSRHDEEDVQIRLAAPFTVEGSAQSDVPPKGVYLTIVDGPSTYSVYADVDGEGRFHLKGVYPSRYRISPSSVAGHYLAQVRLGEQDVTGQTVDLAPGGPPIRLVYRSDVGSVRGSVENGANSTVVLFANGGWDFSANVRCMLDGKFELNGLRPGEYSAVAFNRVEWDLLDEPGFVQRVTSAAAVRVDPGGVASVDLRLTVWPQ